jgi:hypothetical protein
MDRLSVIRYLSIVTNDSTRIVNEGATVSSFDRWWPAYALTDSYTKLFTTEIIVGSPGTGF